MQGQSRRGGLSGGRRGGPGTGGFGGPGGGEGAARRREKAAAEKAAADAAAAKAARESRLAREAEQARERLKELAAAKEAEQAREELKRLNEQRLAKEAAEAREELERLNKQRLAKEAQEALIASGAQTRKDTTTTPSALQERVTINRVLDQNPNIFGDDPDPTDYVLQDEGGLNVLRDAVTKQRIGSVGECGDMLPGPLSSIGSFFLDPKTTTFTVDPLFARQDQFGGLTGGIGSLERQMGGGDGPRQQTTATALLPSEESLEEEAEQEEAEQEVLTGFTGDQRGTGFTSSMGSTGIASTPAAGNYMDYINYAFRPVNLATPFAGQPTQQVTGFNPLFSNNPVYRAAHGGFIGFMDEPLNIMYPSNGNMVVQDGISGILKKYKEIRSEL